MNMCPVFIFNLIILDAFYLLRCNKNRYSKIFFLYQVFGQGTVKLVFITISSLSIEFSIMSIITTENISLQ